MIQQDDFVPMIAGDADVDDAYNAHYKRGDYTISVSYGGMCYGRGFTIKENGSVDGSFEACVWNRKTEEVIPAPCGAEVYGWITLQEVNDLLLQFS